MVKLIAHRGNVRGVDVLKENHPDHIQAALDLGLDVEIDIWYDEGELYLGHDIPLYNTSIKQLENWAKKRFVYAHCKNAKAALNVPFSYGLIPFAHSEDDFIILPDMHLWVHPKAIQTLPVSIQKESIIVVHDKTNGCSVNPLNYYGICTDNPIRYKEAFKL